MKLVKWLLLTSTAALLAVAAFIYAGIYPMGADVPHNRITYWLLETVRERSIARAAADIQTPDLNDAELLLSGGPDYNDMCAQCHLKPGRTQSDMSIGLYPSPPNLTLPVDPPVIRLLQARYAPLIRGFRHPATTNANGENG